MSLKDDLSGNKLTIGSWITLGHSAIAEIMANTGFDWLVIDMEHSVIELRDVQEMVQAIDSANLPSLIRLPSNDANLIKRVMDAGAHGVMVPSVNSAVEAEQAVAAVYYPPRGSRGVGLARAHGYGAEFSHYKKWLEESAIIIVMMEIPSICFPNNQKICFNWNEGNLMPLDSKSEILNDVNFCQN